MVGVSQRPWARAKRRRAADPFQPSRARRNQQDSMPVLPRICAAIGKLGRAAGRALRRLSRQRVTSAVSSRSRGRGPTNQQPLFEIRWNRVYTLAGFCALRSQTPYLGWGGSARNVTGRLKPWTESCRCTRSTWVSASIAIPSAAPRRIVLSATTERGNANVRRTVQAVVPETCGHGSAAAAIPGCEPAARKLIPYVVPDENIIPGRSDLLRHYLLGVLRRMRSGRERNGGAGNQARGQSGRSDQPGRDLRARAGRAAGTVQSRSLGQAPDPRSRMARLPAIHWDDATKLMNGKLAAAAQAGKGSCRLHRTSQGPTLDNVAKAWGLRPSIRSASVSGKRFSDEPARKASSMLLSGAATCRSTSWIRPRR